MNNINYDDDFFGWAEQQAEFIKNSEFEKLDMEHLIDEVSSLGKSERKELISHIAIYFLHLLKIEYQPDFHCRSWDISVNQSLEEVIEVLNENPSLKPQLSQIIQKSYHKAKRNASYETGINESKFPAECPWTVKDIFPEIEDKYC